MTSCCPGLSADKPNTFRSSAVTRARLGRLGRWDDPAWRVDRAAVGSAFINMAGRTPRVLKPRRPRYQYSRGWIYLGVDPGPPRLFSPDDDGRVVEVLSSV